MARKVAAVHGIGNRFEGFETIAAAWLPALNSGLHEAGFPVLQAVDFTPIFFGAIFRPSGTRGTESALSSSDKDWVLRLLQEYYVEAARLAKENITDTDPKGEEPRIQASDETSRGRTPQSLQAILRQLSKSRFFKGLGPERLLVADLREVRRFLHEPNIKSGVLARFEACIEPGTKVLVGHSLGSVVAYEALCKHPEWQIHTLVTLGSPLGIRNLVFDVLTPAPVDGRGVWPHIKRWINIADKGDIVALEKDLSKLFDGVKDVSIYNGWRSHDVGRYLTAEQTGRAIGEGLTA